MTTKNGILLGCGIVGVLFVSCLGLMGLGYHAYQQEQAGAQKPSKATQAGASASATEMKTTPTPEPKVEPKQPPPPPPPAKMTADKVPTPEQLKELVTTIFLDLDKAVKGNDVSPFKRHLASIWRSPKFAENVEKSVKFWRNGVFDFSRVQGLTPVFNPAPALNGEKNLVLKGHFPTTPQLNFDFEFNWEDDGWKLGNYNINPTNN